MSVVTLDLIKVIDDITNDMDNKVGQGAFALNVARAAINKGVSEELVLKTLLEGLCKSHDLIEQLNKDVDKNNVAANIALAGTGIESSVH